MTILFNVLPLQFGTPCSSSSFHCSILSFFRALICPERIVCNLTIKAVPPIFHKLVSRAPFSSPVSSSSIVRRNSYFIFCFVFVQVITFLIGISGAPATLLQVKATNDSCDSVWPGDGSIKSLQQRYYALQILKAFWFVQNFEKPIKMLEK